MDLVTLQLAKKYFNGQKGQAEGVATLNDRGEHPVEQMAPFLGTFPRSETWSIPFGAATTFSMTNGRLYAIPMVLLKAQSITAIGVYVATESGSGGVVRLGVYSEATRAIGSSLASPIVDLVVDAGNVDATTTGAKVINLDEPVQLEAGVYWLASRSQGLPSPAPVLRAITGFNPLVYSRTTMPTAGCIGLGSITASTSPDPDLDLPMNNRSESWPAIANSVVTAPVVEVKFA